MIRSARKSVLAALAVGTLVVGTTAACSGGSDSGDSTIKIGMIQPLSGALAAYGEETQAGFEYELKKINEGGGVESQGGAKIKLVTSDGASDPGKVAAEARRLAGKEGVPLIVGSLLTSQMAAISPVADQLQVPVLSMYAGGSNSELLYTLGFPYAEGYGGTLSKFVEFLNENEDRNIKTAVLVSSDYEAGQQVDKGLKPLLEKASIKVIGRVPLKTGGTDYKPAVTKINNLNPDMAIGLVTTADGITLHQARAATNSEVLFVGGTGGYSDLSVWESVGDDVAKKVLAKHTFGMTTFSASTKQEHLQKFLKEVNGADLNVPIGQHFVQGAQSAWVVKDLLEQAGSKDPAAIAKAFSKVNIPVDSDHLYFARSEAIKFDPSTRFMTNPEGIVIQWKEDGTQAVVWPEQFSTGKPVFTN